MSVKTAGVGHFTIPTAPAAGVSCTSGAANTFTTTYVQLIASTAAALYITGIYVEEAAVTAGTYIVVQLATGAGGSETIIGQYLIAPQTGSTVTRSYRPIHPHIPVATGTRIACKTADSVGAQAKLISLECIAQSNVVDDGIPITTVTTVTNQLTAAAIATAIWQDATAGDFTVASSIGKALYIANIAPGAAGGHFISGSNAGTTTFGALTVTGAATFNLTGNVSGSVGSVVGLTVANLDVAVSTRLATAGYTAPLSAGATANAVWDELIALHAGVGSTGLTLALSTPLTAAGVRAAVGLAAANMDTQFGTLATSAQAVAIKAKTDSLTFTVAGKLDVNTLYVNGIAVTGLGTAGTPWGPV